MLPVCMCIYCVDVSARQRRSWSDVCLCLHIVSDILVYPLGLLKKKKKTQE